VKSFISNLCETTEIAELDLQVGDFELYVQRKVNSVPQPVVGVAAAPAQDTQAPPAAPASVAEPEPSVSSISMSIDESVTYHTSDMVGIFRRGRYTKGKKISSKPVVTEGNIVKKGQTIGFIEQMGTYTPVLACQAGEIVKFVSDEGSAVGYGQNIVSILPFFGGHIIGESKHA